MDGWLGQTGGLDGLGFAQNLNFANGARLTYATTTSITIETGMCNDDTNAITLINLAPLTVNLAVSGVGGLDTGVVAANTTYHVWLIYNPVANLRAGLFSLSDTTPILPAGYTYKRRLGGIRTTDASILYNFRMFGEGRERTVIYRAPIRSIPGGTIGTGLVNANAGGLVINNILDATGAWTDTKLWTGGGNIAAPASWLIPSFTRHGIFWVQFYGAANGANLFICEKGITPMVGMTHLYGTTVWREHEFEMSISATGEIQYYAVTAGSYVHIAVRGYRFTL